MDGWMRRGRKLQNFPLEILRYHLFWCESYTVEYLLFLGEAREGGGVQLSVIRSFQCNFS